MNNIRYKEVLTTAREWYSGLSTKGKIALGCFAVVNLACAFVVVIFHGRITALVLDYAETLRQSGWRGRALFGVLLSVVSFPPLAGFSTLAILVGAVYEWNGIFLVGTVASVMSTLSMHGNLQSFPPREGQTPGGSSSVFASCSLCNHQRKYIVS